eukprot:EG_transcript_23310
MAIKALHWLSENLGIDITGESGQDGAGPAEGVFGALSKSVFGEVKEEDQALPEESWGYEYNPATGRWEPTQNAPRHILQEQQERLQELTSPPKEVAPPPVMAAPPNFTWSRDMKGPKYADHFNSYSNGPPSPAPGLPSPVSPHSPSFASNCIHPASPAVADAPGEVVQQQPTTMLQFAGAPLPEVQAMELPVAGMVQLAAPPPPPPMMPLAPTFPPPPAPFQPHALPH